MSHHEIYDIGTDFLCCSKIAIARHRSNLFTKFQKIPEAQDLDHTVAVSKHDLKLSGTFFLKNYLVRVPS